MVDSDGYEICGWCSEDSDLGIREGLELVCMKVYWEVYCMLMLFKFDKYIVGDVYDIMYYIV